VEEEPRRAAPVQMKDPLEEAFTQYSVEVSGESTWNSEVNHVERVPLCENGRPRNIMQRVLDALKTEGGL
jgi:hypothetical protein